MVTALTYQFQGWLASLMSNPRRRRTVIVVTTMVFVLLVQLPNLVNFIVLRNVKQQANPDKALKAAGKALKGLFEDQKALIRAHASGELNDIEFKRRTEELMHKHELVLDRPRHATAENIEQNGSAREYGLAGRLAAAGRAQPPRAVPCRPSLGLLGMTLIGTASLWRAYRTTVGIYQGQLTKRQNRRAPAVASHASVTTRPKRALSCSKLAFPACRNRSRRSRSRACARSCGRPRRR